MNCGGHNWPPSGLVYMGKAFIACLLVLFDLCWDLFGSADGRNFLHVNEFDVFEGVINAYTYERIGLFIIQSFSERLGAPGV